MDHGDLPIGFGKTRGLGQVAVEVKELEVETLGRNGVSLLGAGALCPQDEARRYRLVTGDAMELPAGVAPSATWRGRRTSLEGEAAKSLLAAVTAGPLQRWVEARAISGERL